MSAYKGQPWSPQYFSLTGRTVAVTGAVRPNWRVLGVAAESDGPLWTSHKIMFVSYFDLCHLEESLMVE